VNYSIKQEVEQLASEFKRFKGLKVLVTGAAGFLGSWLSEVLIEAGAKVECIDNLSTGREENLRNIKGRAKMVIGDIEEIKLRANYDVIFHLASRASVEDYQRHPIDTLRTNSFGTINVLEHAKLVGSTVVYASSSEVYGDAQIIPTPEDYNGNVSPIGPRSCYDEAKRFGEALCMAYFREEKVKVRIARIFNSYGPRMRSDGPYARVIPRFLEQALTGKPITVYGDGRQTRSFCYVTDTIRGLLMLASKEGIDGEAFNIGNTEEITILDLAKKIIDMTGSKSQITFLPPAQDDPRRRCPDISKAKRMLGWQPIVKLDEGLEKLISLWKAEAIARV